MNKIKLYAILGLMTAVVLGGGIILLTAGKVVGQRFFGRNFAERQLEDYVSSVLKQDINGARCQAMDSDQNGYVSCDYTLVSAPENVQSIECAAWGLDGFFNRGCKTRLPNFR